MRTDTRLSRMLHVLLHMARHDRPFTSAQIATMLGTNPVVVRRTMGGLRRAGYVTSVKGHGGGWTLARALDQITLLDIHRAVGVTRLLAIGHEGENPACAVERAVHAALDDTFRRTEALLVERLASVSLAHLIGDFDALCRTGGWGPEGPGADAVR